MKRSKSVVLVFVMMLFILASCGGNWRTPTADTYVGTSIALRAIYDKGVELEKSGVLAGDNLVKVKALYNKARQVFLVCGDILIVINNLDSVATSVEAKEKASSVLNALVNMGKLTSDQKIQAMADGTVLFKTLQEQIPLLIVDVTSIIKQIETIFEEVKK